MAEYFGGFDSDPARPGEGGAAIFKPGWEDIFRMNQKQLEVAVRRMWSDTGMLLLMLLSAFSHLLLCQESNCRSLATCHKLHCMLLFLLPPLEATFRRYHLLGCHLPELLHRFTHSIKLDLSTCYRVKSLCWCLATLANVLADQAAVQCGPFSVCDCSLRL